MTDVRVSKLTCEYLDNPLGIDITQPGLSWIVESEQRGQKQTAYQIRVASGQDLLKRDFADLWDSGKVTSDQCVLVPYKGKPLKSRMHCYWQVRIWDKNDTWSPWSDINMWSMGLLGKNDWQAQWIGRNRNLDDYPAEFRGKDLRLPPSPYLRKTFELDENPVQATLYVTALGLVEPSINGDKVGNRMFVPGWTDYNKRIYYHTFDVTHLLFKGENALGAILADGWYAGYVGFCLDQNIPNPRNQYGDTPALLCQLEVELENGEKQVICSDSSWTSAIGPIKEADLFMGETYDACSELLGWNHAGYIEKTWKPVDLIEPAKGVLQGYPTVPVRRTGEMTPIEITEPEKGVYLFNMGQNFAGFARIKVSGEAGSKIVIRYGEMLHPDGSLMTENLRFARATDTYILNGNGTELWQPRFTYHGFQYVEVRGLSFVPDEHTVTGIIVNSDIQPAGRLDCSDDMVNQLYSNILWTQRSNFFEVPTDCPQRDERCGWSGDAQIYVRSAAYNANIASFMRKWLVDLVDAQKEDGIFTDWAPYSFVFKKEQASGWVDAGVIVPWVIYQMYGDKRLLEYMYPAMRKFIEYLNNRSNGYLLTANENDWGDWLAIGAQTSLDYLATAFYAYDVKLMTEIAAVLGKDSDIQYYTDLFEKIRLAFKDKYVASNGRISEHTQTSYTLALYFGLLDPEQEARAAKYLADLIKENNGNLATGFLGVKHLLPSLTRFGYTDLAYQLLVNTDFPSWGYSVVNGATTIWERWNSYTIDGGFNPDGMNSFSHYAFGSVCEWMFAVMAGIDNAEAGFKKILIKPQPNKIIQYVNSHYTSLYGRIESSWKIRDNDLVLDVTIPANTTAELHLPAFSIDEVKENMLPVEQSGGVHFIEMQGEIAIFELESGSYHFLSEGIAELF